MTDWVDGKVIKIKKMEYNLFKLIINAPISKFIAGQFAKISVKNEKKKRIQRAYSYVNAPNNKNLEFCIRLIPNGIMTNILYNLLPNQKIYISKNSFGFFTINEIPDCEILWMFATSTAIGPFVSILTDKKNLNRFKKIILIYAVQYIKELIYLPLIKKLKIEYQNKLKYQTIVSREIHKTSLIGRIPHLLFNNKIEKNIGYKINSKNSHIMLCGNPEMIEDTKNFLIKNRLLKKHLRRNPGHITSENYW